MTSKRDKPIKLSVIPYFWQRNSLVMSELDEFAKLRAFRAFVSYKSLRFTSLCALAPYVFNLYAP